MKRVKLPAREPVKDPLSRTSLLQDLQIHSAVYWTKFYKCDFSSFLSLIFRIRKGYPTEASLVAEVLPTFLEDFFSPQDVMNKVIGEFLSNQQPHPQLMATIVYRVNTKILVIFKQTIFVTIA